MGKWRKKPVVVEAEVYKPGMEDGYTEYCGWYETPSTRMPCGKDHACAICAREHHYYRPYINTLEGRHYITSTDYIVTGIKGERYPVKNDIFHATYERAEEAASSD